MSVCVFNIFSTCVCFMSAWKIVYALFVIFGFKVFSISFCVSAFLNLYLSIFNFSKFFNQCAKSRQVVQACMCLKISK